MRHNRPHQKKRVLLVLGAVILAALAFILIHVAAYVPLAYNLFFKKEITLKKVTAQEQRVNILVLGIGGAKHDGPDLSDTIIFASLDPKTTTANLVSVPRDLWIPDLKAKINAAYSDGEDKEKGGGITLARAVLEKVLGQNIDYVIRIDFGGFVKAVDMVGGLDINVDRTFDDYAYPITGKEDDTCGFSDPEIASMSAQIASGSASDEQLFPCRYEHLHFDKGLQHMDGETALKFVRSRHAYGPEGTDFARSKRQAKVISAFKDKVFSLNTFLNPVKLTELYNVFKDSIDTDITQDEYADFIKLAEKMQHAQIKSTVLDMGDDTRPGLLVNPPPAADFGYQWILAPRVGNGNFSEIHSFVSCVIAHGTCSVPQTPGASPLPPAPSVSPSPTAHP